MRMWFIDPKLMCRKHLLGEHFEIHKHKHNFVKKHNMAGRLKYPSQIDPARMELRHDEIVKEMTVRGMNHKSDYEQPDVSYLPKAKIDIEYNLIDLACRCEECATKIYEADKNGR
jgi:hypothetical protein